MNNDFVEVGVVLLELLKGFLFINLEHLLFDSNSCSFILFALLLHVFYNHFFERGLGFDGTNFRKAPDCNIFQNVLESIMLTL